MPDDKLKTRSHELIPTLFALAMFALSAVAVTPIAVAGNSYTPTTLSIGGGTLVAPLMTAWINQFTPMTGGTVNINYQAVGSGSGVTNMLSDVFSFASSDAPSPANGLATLDAQGDVTTPANSPPGALAGADPLIQLPEALAPIAIFYNIPSFRKTLNLTGDVITEIFLQHITAWNDPHILALNPGLTAGDITKLAANPISVIHRSDGSGTSFALTYYFGQVDGNWTGLGFKQGSTSSSNFPASELSAKGTGGVAGLVSATAGGIGYGETSYAVGAGLVYAAIQNFDGTAYVLPLPAGATAAAQASAAAVAANPVFTITNSPGTGSYPLSTYTYLYIWSNQNLGTSGGQTWTQGLAFDMVQFLYYIVSQGQTLASNLLYAPLPSAVISIDVGLINKINYGGASLVMTTSTALTCNHDTVVLGKLSDSCAAIVSGGSGSFSGNVVWLSSDQGTFSKGSCAVPKSGKCISLFRPSHTSASETITAEFAGDLDNAPSVATASLVVTQATSKASLVCSPAKVASGSTTSCKAIVIGFLPTAKVSIFQTGGTGAVTGGGNCLLAQLGRSKTTSTCKVTLTAGTAGSVVLSISYAGDSNNAASTNTKTVSVH